MFHLLDEPAVEGDQERLTSGSQLSVELVIKGAAESKAQDLVDGCYVLVCGRIKLSKGKLRFTAEKLRVLSSDSSAHLKASQWADELESLESFYLSLFNT